VSSRTATSEAPTLRDYTSVLLRRGWVIAAVVGLALFAGLVYDLNSTPLYRATSEVLLSRDSPAATLTGTSDVDTKGDPERFIQTQLRVANTNELARRVLDAANQPDRKPSALLATANVIALHGSDVLQFEIKDPSPALASRLARSYATEFVRYQRRLDKAALRRALAGVKAKIAAVEGQLGIEPGETSSEIGGAASTATTPLYEALARRKLQLETLAPLEAGKTLVLSASGEPAKVSPRPKRDLIIALGFGLLVGVLMAFVLEAVDRPVESVRAVAAALGVPLLGQIRLVRRATPSAEGFEALRANFEAALAETALPARGSVVLARSSAGSNGHSRAGAIVLATSPTKGASQSTVVAGLGVALARSGKRVILVDLNPSGPLERLFGIPKGPGAVDVAAGITRLDDAMVACDAETSRLSLLRFGTAPGGVGWLMSAPERHELTAELRTRADLVLLNVPPLTSAEGLRHLATIAQAVLVVVNVDAAREAVLRRFGSELRLLNPLKLGFVATATTVEPLSSEDAGHVFPVAGIPVVPAGSARGAELGEERTHAGARGRRGWER
jgi:Mrp family chromosome partitioning ATPase